MVKYARIEFNMRRLDLCAFAASTSTVCAYLPRIRSPFSFVPCSTLIKEAMCGRPILLAYSYIYSTERMYHLWTLVHQVTSLETPFLSYFRRRRGELRRFSNVNMRRSWLLPICERHIGILHTGTYPLFRNALIIAWRLGPLWNWSPKAILKCNIDN